MSTGAGRPGGGLPACPAGCGGVQSAYMYSAMRWLVFPDAGPGRPCLAGAAAQLRVAGRCRTGEHHRRSWIGHVSHVPRLRARSSPGVPAGPRAGLCPVPAVPPLGQRQLDQPGQQVPGSPDHPAGSVGGHPWACRQAPGSGLAGSGSGEGERRHAPLRQPGREHPGQHAVPVLTGVQPVHSPHALVVDLGARRQIDVDGRRGAADWPSAALISWARRASGRRTETGIRSSSPGSGRLAVSTTVPACCSAATMFSRSAATAPGLKFPRSVSLTPTRTDAKGLPDGERPGQLLTGHVPDQGTTAGQVAQLHLTRRSQEPASRAAQPRQPPCGIWSPIPSVTESPRAANRTTGPRHPVWAPACGAAVTTGSRPRRRPRAA